MSDNAELLPELFEILLLIELLPTFDNTPVLLLLTLLFVILLLTPLIFIHYNNKKSQYIL